MPKTVTSPPILKIPDQGTSTANIPIVTNPNIKAVERSAGSMSPHTRAILINIGMTSLRKSSIYSCLRCSSLATHITRATFAKSEVWRVRPTKGISSHRLASLMSEPTTRVSIKAITAKPYTTFASLAKYL